MSRSSFHRRSRSWMLLRTGAGVLMATALVAACSEPPTTGGGADLATGENGEVELPDCPLDALDSAAKSGPVDVTLWYGGLGGPTKQVMDDTAVRFNGTQQDVLNQQSLERGAVRGGGKL